MKMIRGPWDKVVNGKSKYVRIGVKRRKSGLR